MRNRSEKKPTVICVVGKSGSGKTTIMEKLIPEMRRLGLRVGTVKHHVGDFELDIPGKDSWRHKQAGSVTSIISSPHRVGVVMDVDHDLSLEELVPHFGDVDIILAEGYKRGNYHKVEVYRPEIHDQPFCINDHHLVALVCDEAVDMGVPRFGTSGIRDLAVYLSRRLHLPGDDGGD